MLVVQYYFVITENAFCCNRLLFTAVKLENAIIGSGKLISFVLDSGEAMSDDEGEFAEIETRQPAPSVVPPPPPEDDPVNLIHFC